MKKSSSKLYPLMLVGLFILMLIDVVSATSILDDITGSGGISAALEKLFDSNIFAKILLFILVALIVYAVAGALPFMKGEKTYIAALIAIVVGLLATFFLKVEEINTILLSYGALGITLTGILPFVLITVIAKQLADAGYRFLNRPIWIVFLIITGVRWLTAEKDTATVEGYIGPFGKYVYPLILIAILIMIAIDKQVWKWFRKGKAKGKEEQLKEVVSAGARGIKAGGEFERELIKKRLYGT